MKILVLAILTILSISSLANAKDGRAPSLNSIYCHADIEINLRKSTLTWQTEVISMKFEQGVDSYNNPTLFGVGRNRNGEKVYFQSTPKEGPGWSAWINTKLKIGRDLTEMECNF
ncbi:hypothetical protein [Bdellovibrio sp. HCB2-146]|uniref:hypothetical protein n=1 Tax=Bdellovibrio sp. HCB2-146 TaxID=3394362 RepID=UPI0039BC7795